MASYTNDQRKAARELYETRGARFAADQLGIPQRTIRDWAARDEWTMRLATASGDPAERAARMRAGWAVRKQGLADDAAEASADTIMLYRERVRAKKIYGLHDLARSFALLTERAAEMSAGTGGRESAPVSPEQARELLDAWIDAMEEAEGAGG